MNFNQKDQKPSKQIISTPELLNNWRNSLDQCYEQAKYDFYTCMNEHFPNSYNIYNNNTNVNTTTTNINNNTSNTMNNNNTIKGIKLWEKKKEIREVEQVTSLFRNSPPESNFYKWLGVSEFEYSNGSIVELFSYITKENDMEQRRKWDPDLEELKSIAMLDEKNWRICFQVYNTNTRFVSNREFVIQYDIYEECENVAWLICQSVSDFPEMEDSQAPYRRGNVRGFVHSVAWRIEKINNGEKFKLSFCIHSDPGGMISSTIYNLVSEKQALNTYRIIKAINL
ncbi:START domain-containing protein [Naegleria gruberi]|uniref:START domain-containing protein n=1 Tax=Naegleria gruberi TaxID=5762 RepID=D2V130_NAEGR|nr:START domain-containing protein [Naegleria gruberi]EFC49619.1 START domain-containing protein [Naegleria gruberi]|eukprot:XP_002682363.1 START domain-containing protein [Naegleria gruberi strain NEG-M]